MANEDLKRYMVERLLALDPSLSDDTGARMYTVVIDPLVKRLGVDPLSVDIRQFIEDRMAVEYPDLDVISPGSALADTLVGPLQILLEPLRREIISLRDQRSLADPTILNEDELDALLGNIFANRRTGDFARGVQRVFYNSRTSVGIDNSIVFSTTEGVAFVPDVVRTYGPNDMRRSGGLFYLDIPIRSIEPVETANVDPNTIRFVRNLDGVVRTTNLRAIRFGVARETNETFSDRAARALTERSTNTSRGIETALLDTFSDLVSVATVGYGEPEMQRDILQADVVAPVAEVAGSLIFSTADFKTERAFDLGTTGVDIVVMPFTNLLRIVSPPAAKAAAIKAAKYLRVSDGNGHYTDNPLGRLRGVKEVTDAVDASGDLIVRLTDFEVFPNNADEANPAAPFDTITDETHQGFNSFSLQGGDFVLWASHEGTKYIRGARLPFTDTCGATISASGRPGSVIHGRDFLLIASDFVDPAEPYITAAHPMPEVLRCYPLDGLVSSSIFRVGRADSFANLRERITYTDQASHVYDATPGALGLEARPRIVDFGSPKHSSAAADRTDGIAMDPWGRNPGVKLTTVELGIPGTPATTFGSQRDLLVELEGTQAAWADRGVKPGHFIALAVYEGIEGGGADPFLGARADDPAYLRWHAWGRVVALHTSHQLHVTGIDLAVLNSIVHVYDKGGFATGVSTTYAFAWTVFENNRQMVTPDGRLVSSYDEFNFLPAYQVGTGAEGFIFAPMPAGFEGDSFDGNTVWATNQPLDFTSDRSFWIRLAKPFQDVYPSMGGRPPLSLGGGTVVDLEYKAPNDISHWCAQSRYIEYEPVQVDAVTAHWGLVQFRQGPVIEGAQYFDGTDATGWTQDATHLVNSKGMQGFLLPHPMGSAHTAVGETYEGTLTGDNNLTNQVVQLYADGAVEVPADSKIVVSGIPGSVPFPTAFSGPLEIEDNQVHLGGLTDVYAKFGSETLETADRLLLKPRDLENALEVIASGASGSIDFGEPTQFLSLALESALEEQFDMGSNVEWAHDLVVELVEPPTAIQPKSFRVTNNIAGGAQTDITFTGGSGIEPNLRWRLVQQVTVDLERPVEVMQQGSDMAVLAGALQATFPAGVVFNEGVSDRGMVIKVTTGPNAGEYEVTSKGATTLGVRTPFPTTETAIGYQVLALQNTLVQLPLVRVKSVSLAGENEGVPIPYRHPVELKAGAFAGLNDDPHTDESTGDGTLTCDGTLPATFVAVGVTNWENLGVLKYDVLRIDSVDADLQYWYVVGVNQDETGATDTTSLLLDRVVTSTTLTTLSFTLGHPSVGTVSARFMQRTMFEATQATVFTALDSAGVSRKFRPSPAESTKLYESPVGLTYANIPADGGGAIVEFNAVVNPFATGVAVGDRVDVLSEVLESSGLGATEEVQGKLVAFTVNDVSRAVRFTGTDALTPSAIAADFNRQAGDVLRASVSGGELLLASRHHVQLVDVGSTGILSELGFPNAADRDSRENAAGGSFGTFYVTSIAFADATQVTRLTLEKPSGTPVSELRTNANGVFVDIVRVGSQRLYPAGLTEDSVGLFAGEMKLTSMDPLEAEVVAGGTQMEATGYRSLGYELVVGNTNYSYSMGEKVGLRCTPVVLDEFSTGMMSAYAVVGAGMTVAYERAPGIDAMQTFLLLPAIRVQCHNPLARHFFPAYPAFSISYRGTPTTAAVKQAVGSFLASKYPNRAIETYDIVKTVSAMSVTSLDLPQEVAVLAHDASRRVKLRSSLSKLDLGNQFHIMGDVTGVKVTKS